jgi:hypothetical protein
MSLKWVGHVTHIGDIRNAYKIVVGILKVTHYLLRSMWDNNIKLDVK